MKTQKILAALLCLTLVAPITSCKKDKKDKDADEPTDPKVETSGKENNHMWVDLGTSVRWAVNNVGATTSYEAGMYVAWGETTQRETNTYKYTTYALYDNDNSVYLKYFDGDGKTLLDQADDVAKKEMGGTWRIPTKAQWQELCDKCTWKLTQVNDVWGFKVTGTTKEYIFLPIVGYLNGNTGLQYNGKQVRYWTNQLYTEETDNYQKAWTFNLYRATDGDGNTVEADSKHEVKQDQRYYGGSVRAVCSK